MPPIVHAADRARRPSCTLVGLMAHTDDYPTLAARTGRFGYGRPRTLSVADGGGQVLFLRSAGPTDPVHALWSLDVATGREQLVTDPRELSSATDADLPAEERAMRERRRESAGGITSYAWDGAEVVVFPLAGRVFRAVLPTGGEPGAVELPTAGPAVDPRPAPAGSGSPLVAYVTGGALRVTSDGGPGADRGLVAEDGVTWGLAEFVAAEEMSRYRGYWWSGDGTRLLVARVDDSAVTRWHVADPAAPEQVPQVLAYPAAGTANAEVTLHLVAVDGATPPVPVDWDRTELPYLVTAGWDEHGPLVTVMSRDQRQALVLAVDPGTGATTVLAETADPVWVEVLPGTPLRLPDGRLVLGEDSGDRRSVTLDGAVRTPPELYTRGVVGRLGDDLLVEGTVAAPEQNHLWLVPVDGPVPAVGELRRLTDGAGWHRASSGGGATLAVASASLDQDGARWEVRAGDRCWRLADHGADLPYRPRPALSRVTARALPAAVLYPRDHRPGVGLPVLMDPYGGPHHQEIVAARTAWQEPQWWADQGFAVVVVDGRGTPGVSPGFERAVHLDLAGPVLDDQVDALRALATNHPDLDLSRVGIRGWSFGGYLAALAVLRRPDVFHTAVAGAPVTEWRLYDTFYTERYLGLPAEHPEAYDRCSLLVDAPALRRPLLIVHGLADDNVVAAHTLRLSSALLAAGRPHQVLPLTGVTHMTSGETVAENLLRLQLDFLRRSLS
jgi:dipeptidyl-peptidase-4